MRNSDAFQPDGLWLVTGAAILWGTIGAATQAIYNVDSTTSLFINLARMLVATPVLMLACWSLLGRKMFAIQRRDLLIMLLSGALLAISHAAYFAAIRMSGVTIATLLTICMAPIVVASASVLLKFDTLTWRTVLALGCALAGSFLLVGSPSSESSLHNLTLGPLCALIAAATYGGVIVCGRFLAADYHPLQVTTVAFSSGTILLVFINLISGMVMIQTVQGWLLILYLGLVPTAFAYWLLQMGLRSTSATAASIIGMLDPLVAALLAWALFGERLVLAGMAGAGLLLLSLLLLAVKKSQRRIN